MYVDDCKILNSPDQINNLLLHFRSQLINFHLHLTRTGNFIFKLNIYFYFLIL